MTRLPARFTARFALAAAVSAMVFAPLNGFAQEAAPAPAAAQSSPAPSAPAQAAPAQPAPAEPAPAQPAPAQPDAASAAPSEAESAASEPSGVAPGAAQAKPSKELLDAVENYWHYGKIARYDLAAAAAKQVIEHKNQPVAVLKAFEQAASERKDNLDQWLLRWQGIDQLRQPTAQIITILNQGRRTRRSDPAAIEANVKRLITPRGYPLAMRELQDSGELAVPIMIDYLRDPSKAQYHAAIRDGLRDLKRRALNPLVAVTETKNQQLLIPVVTILGDIGYGTAIPYIARVLKDPSSNAAVRNASQEALLKMGVTNPQALNPSDLFDQLGERFYYDNADITADRSDPKAPANMWYWNEQTGLTRKQVPQPIFNELMAMREAEYSLKLGQASGDALSLWLASNYKREVELPKGMTDPTRQPGQPSAHFYGVDSGVRYLNSALARTLHDRNWPVSLKVIKSLQEVAGRTNLFAGGPAAGGAPSLIDAMSAPDRLVRFESAFAVAGALPSRPFEGQERVVPLLAEAISQTGKPSALVMEPNQNELNSTIDALKQAGYVAVGATNPQQAVATANQLPAVDIIIMPESMGAAAVDQLLATATNDAKLAGAARLVVVRSNASPFAARAITDPLLSVTEAPDAKALKTAADEARAKATSVPIDQASATHYALRGADLLHRLALTQIQSPSPVFNLAGAEQTLLSALDDARPEVVKAAGGVLALLNSQPAQGSILQTAIAKKSSEDVTISLLHSLAISAKFFGNRLNPLRIKTLDQVITTTKNADTRNAAGEARGALNLPADQAKTLILQQSRV
jgi:CheY-like chemotaxis protein